MNYDEWRAEARRWQQASLTIERALMRIRARKVREQRDADEEGAGSLLCAIRQARREMIRGIG